MTKWSAVATTKGYFQMAYPNEGTPVKRLSFIAALGPNAEF